jgi:hypothetical protein
MKHMYLYICLSLLQLNSYACKLLCIRDGYSGGYMADKQCACIDLKGTPEQLAKRSINLGEHIEPDVPAKTTQPKGGLYISPSWGFGE